jgi:hypothetical protein
LYVISGRRFIVRARSQLAAMGAKKIGACNCVGFNIGVRDGDFKGGPIFHQKGRRG